METSEDHAKKKLQEALDSIHKVILEQRKAHSNFLAVINSGAAIAILSFLGSAMDNNDISDFAICAVKVSLAFFSLGLIVIGIGHIKITSVYREVQELFIPAVELIYNIEPQNDTPPRDEDNKAPTNDILSLPKKVMELQKKEAKVDRWSLASTIFLSFGILSGLLAVIFA